jgi:hypothetical protein
MRDWSMRWCGRCPRNAAILAAWFERRMFHPTRRWRSWVLTKSFGLLADSPSRCQRMLGSRTRGYLRPSTRPAAHPSPDSWASVLPLRSAAEQMPQGLLEVRAAESVICLLQPRRQHPLVGAREFPRTLLAE